MVLMPSRHVQGIPAVQSANAIKTRRGDTPRYAGNPQKMMPFENERLLCNKCRCAAARRRAEVRQRVCRGDDKGSIQQALVMVSLSLRPG